MTDPSLDRDRVEILAAEFVDALREGEDPKIEQYAEQYPEHAEQIRDLFPTIIAMEQLKSEPDAGSDARNTIQATDIKRLGDLRIIREIGRGGMGIVYEAEQESLGRRVAVKVLPKQHLNSEKSLARFLRESKTAAKLHHTNIVPVLGVGADDGYHYYVMQYVRGVGLDEVIGHLRGSDSTADGTGSTKPPADLSAVAVELLEQDQANGARDKAAAHIDETISSSGPLKDTDLSGPGSNVPATEPMPSAPHGQPLAAKYWRSVAMIARDVASALAYAHEHRTLHRDIKPSNLLLDSDGVVSVADFGLAKSIGQDDLSRTGDIVGTLRYMAPEQFTGNSDQRSDVYSLGVTLYELVTLHPAYDESERARTLIHGSAVLPPRPRQIRRDIPRDLETIILKSISIEPDRRYQTADAMATDLRRFCEDRPILARRTSPVERLWRWSRRNPAIASLCAVAASLLIAIAAISSIANYKTNQAREAADNTAELAFDALDRIFDRLAPLPTVGADAFSSVDTEEDVQATVAPPVLTKQSAALLDEMLLFYDRLAAEGNDDARYRERLAEANRRIGDIRQRLGQYDLAEAAYRKSLDLYVAFDESEKTPRIIASIAAIHNELGKSLQRPPMDRTPDSESMADFKIAQALLEPIAGNGSPPEVRYELANTYYLLGRKAVGGRDGPGGGPGGGRKGGRGRPGPDRDRPDRNGTHRGGTDRGGTDRGGTDRGGPDRGGPDHHHTRGPDRDGPERGGPPPRHPPIGDLDQRRDPRSIDRESLAKAIELLEQLTAEYPDRPDYQRLLATSYLESTKDHRIANSEQGQRLRSEAIDLLSVLVERFPNHPDYRFALSAAYQMGTAGRTAHERIRGQGVHPEI